LLPAPLRDDVLDSGPADECDLDRFYALVAAELEQPFGRAVEHAKIFATAVSACLEPGELPMLTSHLPAAIAELFRRPAPIQSAPSRTLRGTLAGGAPGSQRPISSAKPRNGRPDSIAERNSRAERKLSSSRPGAD
jgi:hypothetical protein